MDTHKLPSVYGCPLQRTSWWGSFVRSEAAERLPLALETQPNRFIFTHGRALVTVEAISTQLIRPHIGLEPSVADSCYGASNLNTGRILGQLQISPVDESSLSSLVPSPPSRLRINFWIVRTLMLRGSRNDRHVNVWGGASVVPCPYPFEIFICDSSQSQNNCGSRWQDRQEFQQRTSYGSWAWGQGEDCDSHVLLTIPPLLHRYLEWRGKQRLTADLRVPAWSCALSSQALR